MYGAIFWFLFLLIITGVSCCIPASRKFYFSFCGNNTITASPNNKKDVELAGIDVDADATSSDTSSATVPPKNPALLAACVAGILLTSYLLAALLTAVYISAAIDLFPGDTYKSCGETNPSATDGATKCNWEHYPLTPASRTEEITFKSADGTTDLVGWWLNATSVAAAAGSSSFPSEPPAAALLYHHGSGINIAAEYRENRYDVYLKRGISVFAYDYPEYGKSQGVASEDSVNAAAKGALAWLLQRTGAKGPEDLIQLGRSLGGAVAVRLASDLGKEGKSFKGTIIQSAFSSYADATASFFPTTAWAAKSAVGPMFNSVSYVEKAKGCLFHYHGVDDEWVPVTQGEELHAAATGFTEACTPKMYTDAGVLHDAPMTDKLIAATMSWMTDDLKLSLW